MEHQHTPENPPAKSDAVITESAKQAARSPDLEHAILKGYEPHDLKLGAVIKFVAVLAITLVVVLSVVYGIMMAMASYDRSRDPLASPVAVKLPPVYAPLQPSLGFYGDDANNHPTVDAEDMVLMREKVQQELNAPAGVSRAGRPHMPIDAALNEALPLLLTKAVIAAPQMQEYPPGSYEGHIGSSPLPEKKPGLWYNDIHSLNDQGN